MAPTKKKKMMSIELKREIIEKYEQGLRVTDLARMYGRSTSMISTMLKRKELLKAITPTKGVTIISKLRTAFHAKMENLLLEWMAETQLEGEILTESIICEKARAIYGDLLKHTTSTNEESEDTFKASKGWFVNFRKRNGILIKAAEVCINPLPELIETKEHIHYQPHVTTSNLYPAWKELWVKAVTGRPLIASEPEVIVVEEIVSLEKSTGREKNGSDVKDKLVEGTRQKLTIDQLHDLHSQQHPEARRKNSFKKEPKMQEYLDSEDAKEILGM